MTMAIITMRRIGLVLAGVKLIFFTVTGVALCFGFALNSADNTRFCYC